MALPKWASTLMAPGFWITIGNGVWDAGDLTIMFGNSDYIPKVGDWNGSGSAKLGLYKINGTSQGTFLLDYNGSRILGGTPQDISVIWKSATPGDIPVIGDWNGNGRAKIGIYTTDGTWILDYNGSFDWDPQNGDKVLNWTTQPVGKPVIGDWNGNGTTKIGVYHDGTWITDYNGNYIWEGPSVDKLTYFGGADFVPVVGNWTGGSVAKIAAYLDGTWWIDVDGSWDWNQQPDVLTNFGGADYLPIVGAWPSGQQYSLTTTANPPGAGTITLNPSGGWYNSGAVVTVRATPNPGYQFTEFSGSLSGTANPQNLTITGTSSVTANYQAVSVSDFSLSSRTGSRILAAGRSGQYTVSVQPINGFADPVSFSASGLPYGATATFNPPSITGSGSTAVTVSTTSGSVTNNPISITITGTSGSLIRSAMTLLTVNPPGYSIYPVAVEMNLGGVPLSKYFLPNDQGGGTPFISHCPVTYTIRQCIAKLFNNDPGNPIAQGSNGVPVEWNNWVAQGVTGVRFFFGVAGGFGSMPYIPNSPPYSATHPTIQSGMQPEAAWVNNLNAFFQDLGTYGIQRVTPTPVLDDWGWDYGKITVTVPPVCGDPQKTELYFLPFLPFGYDPNDRDQNGNPFPDRTCGDQSYQNGQSPATPDYIFWGWDRFFNLMDRVISKAAGNQLIVNTLDYYQETNMAAFTVQARVIYDNTRNVDVVANLQDIMGYYHYNVFSGIDPLGASPSANGPAVPTSVTGNCVSAHYGDSGQLLTLSALVAGLKGNKAIGQPGSDGLTGLPCGSLLSGGTDVPVGRRLFPGFIDIHSQMHFNLVDNTAAWSKNFHDQMKEFVFTNGFSGKRIVFGETNSIDPGCNDPWTKEQAAAMLYGIPGSGNGFVNSTLFSNYAGNVVMRPWQDISYAHSACMGFPNTINPPFNPMQ